MLRALSIALIAVASTAWPVHAAESDGKEQKAPEHKITQSKSYVMVDPIYTPIVTDNRARGR